MRAWTVALLAVLVGAAPAVAARPAHHHHQPAHRHRRRQRMEWVQAIPARPTAAPAGPPAPSPAGAPSVVEPPTEEWPEGDTSCERASEAEECAALEREEPTGLTPEEQAEAEAEENG